MSRAFPVLELEELLCDASNQIRTHVSHFFIHIFMLKKLEGKDCSFFSAGSGGKMLISVINAVQPELLEVFVLLSGSNAFGWLK
jgi:hypothetical protein